MTARAPTSYRQIRATYDDAIIRVYQAYSHTIADAALARGTFVSPPFKRDRMTWIKPSFRWMLYRCGWGAKDPGQARVLAIDLTRAGFEWALAHASLSTHGAEAADGPGVATDRQQRRAELRSQPVRIQWDPERDLRLQPLDHRSIQIGLGGEAVHRYVDEWIVAVHDVTDLARSIGAAVAAGDLTRAAALLPPERPYDLPGEIARLIGAGGEETRDV